MTGMRGDPRFGRGRVGPLQAVTPTRLPGGVWGPPATTGIVTFDAQGVPLEGFGDVPAGAVALTSARAEWPLPVRWEAQVFLALERVSFTGNPPAPVPNWSNGAIAIEGLLQWRVESAQAEQPLQLVFGPGLYPLLAAINGVAGLSSTLPLIAQQVETRITRVGGIGDPSLANSSYRWSVSTLLGLTSAGWPNP